MINPEHRPRKYETVIPLEQGNSKTGKHKPRCKKRIRFPGGLHSTDSLMSTPTRGCMRINFNERGGNSDSSVYASDVITLENYLAKRNSSASTMENARQKLHSIVYKYHIYTPTEEGLDKLLAQLRANNAPQSTMNAYHNVMIHWAKSKGMPVWEKRKFKITDKKYRPYTFLEVQTMIAKARNVRDKAIIAMFAATGLRRKELMHLYVVDVDAAVEYIHLKDRGQGLKNHHERDVPVPAMLRSHLKAYMASRNLLLAQASMESPYLFIGQKGDKLSEDAIYGIVRDAADNAGISFKDGRHGHVHSLRRYYLSTVCNNGTNLEVARRIAGHSSTDQTSRYITTEKEDMTRAVKNIRFF